MESPVSFEFADGFGLVVGTRTGQIRFGNAGQSNVVAQKVEVFHELEDGLLGIAIDPKDSQWLLIARSLPEMIVRGKKKFGMIRVSRFPFRNGLLNLEREETVIEIETQRDTCCHVAGGLAFDDVGNLFIGLGENSNPFGQDGFAPTDERTGREYYDSQRSSANTMSLLGKILRIKPKPAGGYTIPDGNLFPKDATDCRPEIYVMGCRNPFRLEYDRRAGILYWSDPAPDAAVSDVQRGSSGLEEINQTRRPGNYGWPHFIGPNLPYRHFDFVTRKSGEPWNADLPLNESPNNTGRRELPPAHPAFIWYGHRRSKEFPELSFGTPGCPMVGPVYYFDQALASKHKLPEEFNHCLFFADWRRNWIAYAKLDENEGIARDQNGNFIVKRILPDVQWRRPVDLKIGPDGCLYVLEWGSQWGGSKDGRLTRIEMSGKD
jgi:cytochrome c